MRTQLCDFDGVAALSPWDRIGSHGARNFMLCKKPQGSPGVAESAGTTPLPRRRSSGSWKAWFNKSLSLKISSHWLMDTKFDLWGRNWRNKLWYILWWNLHGIFCSHASKRTSLGTQTLWGLGFDFHPIKVKFCFPALF